jgi:lipoate-protein ligase A
MNRALSVVRGALTGDAALDTAVSRAILLAVTEGTMGETLQVGTPHRVVAFGKHDTLAAGFGDALTIARDHGYDATVRIAGGRAVVFSPTIVRFAWTIPAEAPATSMHERFRRLANAVVGALSHLGVASTIGELPDEYCAGEYSVHVLGARKVMGVGQRLSRSAAQVGGMIVVSDPDDINGVLVPVYRALGVPLDPAATGSLADVADVDVETVTDAFVAELADGRGVSEGSIHPSVMERAMTLRSDHVPDRFAPPS